MACSDTQVRKLQHTRNFLNIPALAGACGTQVVYYGQDCQLMELTGAQRNIRNASAPLRTWNKRSRTFCNIGNTVSAPDIPAGTLRFYEGCGRGIPLPHMLGDCDIHAVINHGLCKSQGSICDFEDYAEVHRLNILNENRGRRTSFDGADDPLINELNIEFLETFDVSTMEFTDVLAADVAAGNISADSFASDIEFLCESGCGITECGCTESCNDGTRVWYIGIGSPTLAAQVVASSDNGVTTTVSTIPQGASTAFDPVTSLAVFNGRLYALAYSDPTQLLSIGLNDNGDMVGAWNVEQTYVAVSDPVKLKVCGNDDTLGILTDRNYYQINNTDDGSTSHLAAGASSFNGFDCCGSTIVIVGVAGTIFRSTDGGINFSTIVAPTADSMVRVSVESTNVFWVSTGIGEVYRTIDGGANWTQIPVAGLTPAVNAYLTFANQDIGYVISATGQLISTWLGGLSGDTWCGGTNRIGSYPTGFTGVFDVVVPDCANANLQANTVAVVGRIGTDASALIGRPQITF